MDREIKLRMRMAKEEKNVLSLRIGDFLLSFRKDCTIISKMCVWGWWLPIAEARTFKEILAIVLRRE